VAHVEVRSASKILVGKPEGKRPLGRHRHKWKGNIEMDVRQMKFVGVDWIKLFQDGLMVCSCEHGNEP
jgi:hypothetical protein